MNYKCAIIGYGYWGKIIEKHIISHSKFSISAIHSRSIINHKLYVDDYTKIVSKNIDIVFITTPLKSQFFFTKYYLENNINVICEKPLSNNLNQFKILNEIANKKNKFLLVDYIYLHSKLINKLKSIIGSDMEFNFIEFRFNQFGKHYLNETASEIIGCHVFSILCFIFPELFNSKESIVLFNHDKKNYNQSIIIKSNKNCQILVRLNLNSLVKERLLMIEYNDYYIIADILKGDINRFFKGQTDPIESISFDESGNIENLLNFIYEKDSKKIQNFNFISSNVTNILAKLKNNAHNIIN